MLKTHLSRIVAGVMLRIDVLLIAIWPPLRMPHLLHITPAILSRIFLQVWFFYMQVVVQSRRSSRSGLGRSIHLGVIVPGHKG